MRSNSEFDEEIPSNVKVIESLFSQYRKGFKFSRNAYAGSCRDARSKRYRLGNRGIPLSDELKSIIGKVVNHKQITYVALHCRGDMEICVDNIIDVLNIEGEFAVLNADELFAVFNMEYGTVNPFVLSSSETESINQIFDSRVFEQHVKLPGTMMTNAGDHTWAIEFDPLDLKVLIPDMVVAKIAEINQATEDYEELSRLNLRSIGLITGNGPDSGMALWQLINDNVKEIMSDKFLGDLSLPEVNVLSVPGMGLSMELKLRKSATWRELSRAVETLCNHGVDILCLACHTTHYFSDQIKEICKKYGVTFLSMPEVVVSYLQKKKITEFALLGIPSVADLGEWSAYSTLNKYNPEILDSETLDSFLEIGYLVKQKQPFEKSFQKLIHLIKKKIKSENVIIALTELSILLQKQSNKKRRRNIIDALELYGEAIAKASLGLKWH